MSRLSKVFHKIHWDKVVTELVVLAEVLLGGGTGALKKKLVLDIIAAIARRAKEAGVNVPDNYQEIVDALIEMAVAIFNKQGWIGTDTDPAPAAAPAPAIIKRGRPAKIRLASVEELTDEDVALLESLEA